MIVNRRELSDYTGSAESTLQRWADEEGMPVTKRGKQGSAWEADTKMVFAWLLERERTASDSTKEVSRQRARLLRAQSEKAELEAKEMRGELVKVEDVAAYWGEMMTAFRARLLTIPRVVAARLPVLRERRAECETIIRGSLYEAMTELADDGVPRSAKARQKEAEKA